MYERPDGSWDWDREEADHDTRSLQEAAEVAYQMRRKSLAALLKGEPEKAARLCPHSAVGAGSICRDCGARLNLKHEVVEIRAGLAGCPRCGEPLNIIGVIAECCNTKPHNWQLKS
jgi:predicted amidophosphoribosyltransferase